MTDLVLNNREAINALQAYTATQEQATDLVTKHLFVNVGDKKLYCRKVFIPANRYIVGREHKHEHFFVLAAGEMIVWTDTEKVTLKAGDVVPAPSGVKRVLLTLTDCVGMNFHITSSDNLADLESELLTPDATAMFDINNDLKQGKLTI
jgi:quercetin dioxygenase-like cupin family protein